MRISSFRLSRGTRWRIVVFVVLATVFVSYGAISYLNAPRLLGLGRYSATVQLPTGAGLYVNGVVTLRGVPVGQVDAVRLTPTGAVADIQVRDDVPIPRDSKIEIRSTSAVGEQYLNFEPHGARNRQVLADGDVIPAGQVTIPVSTADLLERVNGLLKTVPLDKLNTTVDQFYEAFQGTGQDLQRLIDSTSQLQTEANASVDSTVTLIQDAQPVLRTQRAGADDIRSYFSNLASFTRQLADSDADLRGTLRKTPGAVDQLAGVLKDLDDPLPDLLTNLTNVGKVTRVYIPHLAQTLTLAQPVFNRSLATITGGAVPGTIKINLQAELNNPSPCVEGFIQERRPPSDVSPARPGVGARCKDPDRSKGVRGAGNALCPPRSPRPDGRSPDAAGCGLRFQSPEEAVAAREAAIRTQLDVYAKLPRKTEDNELRPPQFPASGSNTNPDENYPYGQSYDGTGPDAPAASRAKVDPLTGVFMAPGTSTPQIYGNMVPSENEGWPSFLLNPLGVNAPNGGR